MFGERRIAFPCIANINTLRVHRNRRTSTFGLAESDRYQEKNVDVPVDTLCVAEFGIGAIRLTDSAAQLLCQTFAKYSSGDYVAAVALEEIIAGFISTNRTDCQFMQWYGVYVARTKIGCRL